MDIGVAEYARSHACGGLEFLSGIPGTIGGALAMNAGAFGNDVSNCLIEASVMMPNGEVVRMKSEDIGYVYRSSSLPEGVIFIEGLFRGYPERPDVIVARMNDIKAKRELSQPINEKTLGSVFKNPAGRSSWQLIEEAGCRGMRIGNASVSTKHANFFVAQKALDSAGDYEKLISMVQERVLKTTGVMLEREVKLVGNAV